MKTIRQTAKRLTVGCVLGLSLTTIAYAQTNAPNGPQVGAFYSAKDPELPPRPFNPDPSLVAVQIQPGVFVVDDTKVPDTVEQVVDRIVRQVAAQQAKAIANNPVAAKGRSGRSSGGPANRGEGKV